jgi:hypothetical protein
MDQSVAEEWRPVLGYEGLYSVSNLGRVRIEAKVHKSKTGWERFAPSKIMAQARCVRGYARVQLTKDGTRVGKLVSRLVAEAFIGPAPKGYEVCHGINGNTDNSLSNIYYGTKQRNERDKVRDGTVLRGEKVHWTKLKKEDAIAIRNSTENQRVLAARYGVHFSNISAIQLRKSWKHVP